MLDTASQCLALPGEARREVTFSSMRWVQCWCPHHGVMQMALNSTHVEPRAELAPCRGSVSASCPLAPLPVPRTYPLGDSGRSLAASVSSVLYL